LLAAGKRVSSGDVGRAFSLSTKTALRYLDAFEMVSWVRREGKFYEATQSLGTINIYDPAQAAIIGPVVRKILIAVKDYHPSTREAALLTGVPAETTRRQIQQLSKAEIIKPYEKSGWQLAEDESKQSDSLSLWPVGVQRDSLRDFITALAKATKTTAVVLHGAPLLHITVVHDGVNAKSSFSLGDVATEALLVTGLVPDRLIIATKHAWLLELHRLHIPPSVTLRNALLGLAVQGTKPTYDAAELFRLYNYFAPVNDELRRKWSAKRWLTTIHGVPAFTPIGMALTRKRGTMKVSQKVFESKGIKVTHIFA
jgi:DNA-binding transcriptional regulator YhcF (GntR family)